MTRSARGRLVRGRIPLLLLALAASLPLAAPEPVAAQRGRPPTAEERAQLEERIRSIFARRMQERLDLDEGQAERLSLLVQEYDSLRRELFAEEQRARREAQAMLAAPTTDQAAARALLARIADLRVREAQLFRTEQEALLEILTPAQVLELNALREDLGRRIRALRNDRDDGRPRRGGGRIGERRMLRGAFPLG